MPSFFPTDNSPLKALSLVGLYERRGYAGVETVCQKFAAKYANTQRNVEQQRDINVTRLLAYREHLRGLSRCNLEI